MLAVSWEHISPCPFGGLNIQWGERTAGLSLLFLNCLSFDSPGEGQISPLSLPLCPDMTPCMTEGTASPSLPGIEGESYH